MAPSRLLPHQLTAPRRTAAEALLAERKNMRLLHRASLVAAEGGCASPSHVDRPTRPLRALVITGSVGAGHNGAARELVRRLEARGIDATYRDYLDALPRRYQRLLQDGYTFSAGRTPEVFDWLFRCEERESLVRSLTLRLCRQAARELAGWLGPDGQDYDVVVTTFPFAAQSLGMLRADGTLKAPAVCYLTDPAPHRLWVHPAVDVHLTVTPATAAEGSKRYGVPMRPAGPLAPAAFAEPVDAADRQAVRTELGVPLGHRMVLLTAGSMGLGDVMSGVRALRAVDRTVPVVLCGRNESLRRRIAALSGVVALGWRNDVPRLMAAADVLVHNAGGLSLTEALVAGLPAVSYEVLSGHGRANAGVLARAGLAPWPRTPDALARALEEQAARGRVTLPPLPADQQAAAVVADLAKQHRDTTTAPEHRLRPVPAGGRPAAAGAGTTAPRRFPRPTARTPR
ncbi:MULTISPECIES: glycosyltransferase [unclassified Kitasatospora]|uniref:glycosyltransferase n=1 Tax=unclassified Kitasatospora TaxID=2633591 RepID=UPI002476E1A8|nr:glycosyltransferase [Kitasatospora sp. MAP12-44]